MPSKDLLDCTPIALGCVFRTKHVTVKAFFLLFLSCLTLLGLVLGSRWVAVDAIGDSKVESQDKIVFAFHPQVNSELGSRRVSTHLGAKKVDGPKSEIKTGFASIPTVPAKLSDESKLTVPVKMADESKLTVPVKLADVSKLTVPVKLADVSKLSEASPKPTISQRVIQVKNPGKFIHEVQKGDRLDLISKNYYGTHSRYKDILKANPGLDPSKLKLGDKIVIPDIRGGLPEQAEVFIEREEPKLRDYVVKPGELLGTISKRELGSSKPEHVHKILEANPGLDPKKIKVGQVIRLPVLDLDARP